MRKVLSNAQEVAHYWANQIQSEGRCKASFSFEGTKLYSYSACVANLLEDRTVVFSTESWSLTTSKHQNLAQSAANHLKAVYCQCPGSSASYNMELSRERIAHLLGCIQPKFRKDGVETIPSVNKAVSLKAKARTLAVQANEYLAAFQRNNLGLDQYPIAVDNLEGVVAEMKRQEEEAILRQRLLDAAVLEDAKLALVAWRKHEQVWSNLQVLPCALRLNPDKTEVQTSHGARIPVGDALNLWKFLLKIRGREVDVPSGERFPLGPYNLDRIEADGSIIAGCHKIAFEEILGIAKELEL